MPRLSAARWSALYAYDSINRQTRVIEAVGLGEQRTTTIGYDKVSNVLSVVNPRGFTAYDNIYRYDKADWVATEVFNGTDHGNPIRFD